MNLRVSKVFFATFVTYLFVASANAAISGVRPALKSVTAIVIYSGFSKKSARIEDTTQIQGVVNELNFLRQSEWKEWIGKFGACSRRAVFLSGEDQVLSLYVDAKRVVELSNVRGGERFVLPLDAKDAPEFRKLISKIDLPKGCSN